MSAEIVTTPSYLDVTQADLVGIKLRGLSNSKIARQIGAPVEWVRGVLDTPAARGELARRRRLAIDEVNDAAVRLVKTGVDVVQTALEADPQDSQLGIQAIRAGSLLLTKVVSIDVQGAGVDPEIATNVEWLLEQASKYAVQLEHGSAYTLDVVDGEIVDGWDLL
jgi:hypothetical protein